MKFLPPLLALLLAPLTLLADDWKPETGFVSLFNGKDLTGWHYKDEPANILDGKTDATDGRYSASRPTPPTAIPSSSCIRMTPPKVRASASSGPCRSSRTTSSCASNFGRR